MDVWQWPETRKMHISCRFFRSNRIHRKLSQVLILFFNLLPIPGLDGWNAIFSLLSKRIGNSISHFLSYPLLIGFIACILWVEEFTTLILSNVFLLIDKLGLDKNLVFEGYSYIIIIDTNTLVLLKDRLIELFLVIFKKMDLILG